MIVLTTEIVMPSCFSAPSLQSTQNKLESIEKLAEDGGKIDKDQKVRPFHPSARSIIVCRLHCPLSTGQGMRTL